MHVFILIHLTPRLILLFFSYHALLVLVITFVYYRTAGPKQEYVRSQVLVHPLGSFTPVPAASEEQAVEEGLSFPTVAAAAGDAEQAQTVLPAQTYVWCHEDSRLDEKLWSYDEFARKNAWKWIDDGAQSGTNKDYTELDRERERLRSEAVRSG
jgi:hypothetical protein